MAGGVFVQPFFLLQNPKEPVRKWDKTFLPPLCALAAVSSGAGLRIFRQHTYSPAWLAGRNRTHIGRGRQLSPGTRTAWRPETS
jgi:hypothetical protein